MDTEWTLEEFRNAVPHLIALALAPVIATALLLVSQRRGWSPPLWAALIIGLVLRLGMLAAQRGGPYPWDFAVDFHSTAVNVLSLHDPVLNIREGGWHFLSLMAYVLAGQLWFARVTGLSWNTTGHLVPIIADLVLMVLVGRLARGHGALRRFQWACNPLAIMVCALHGQIEPLALGLGVGAFVVARSQVRHRAIFAGVLAGLSITTNSWPVLLLPGILLTLPGARRRFTTLAWSAAVPIVFLVTQPLFVRPFTYRYLPDIIKTLLHTRAIVGDWGWTSLATGGAQQEVPLLGKIGTLLLAAGVIAALWWWRRAHPIDLTIAILIAFLIVTHRMGTQYLLWPLPFLFAHPSPSRPPNRAASRRSILPTTRATPYLVLVSSAWAWAGYGPLTVLGTNPVHWRHMHVGWAWSSLAVIAVLVWALPWKRRVDPEPAPPDTPAPEPERITATP
jgi:hypothetical protein